MISLIKHTFYKARETKEKLVDFIRSAKQLSFGPECKKFEKNFAVYQGRKHAVFLNSGSSANLALIQALLNLGRLKDKDQVGFSALTWSTNVMPIIQLGLTPVPIDVELETLNVSSKKVLAVLREAKLKVLFLTNLLGFCGDLDQIKKICQAKKIILLEDNCEALGSEYKGQKLGNFGLASTFSFFVGHHMSTIEGGAICTDDSRLANALRMVRAHGWDRQLDKLDQQKMRNLHRVDVFYGNYTFYHLGYNFRPTEINGFLGNCELRHIHHTTRARNRNFLKFAAELYHQSDKYFPLKFDHMEFVSNFAVPVICRTKKIHSELVRRCAGIIEVRPIVGGDLTRQPFFNQHLADRLPQANTNAKLIHEQGLYFANNPHLTEKEIKTILSVFA